MNDPGYEDLVALFREEKEENEKDLEIDTSPEAMNKVFDTVFGSYFEKLNKVHGKKEGQNDG